MRPGKINATLHCTLEKTKTFYLIIVPNPQLEALKLKTMVGCFSFNLRAFACWLLVGCVFATEPVWVSKDSLGELLTLVNQIKPARLGNGGYSLSKLAACRKDQLFSMPFVATIASQSELYHADTHTSGIPWGPGWFANNMNVPLKVVEGAFSGPGGVGYLGRFRAAVDIPLVWFYDRPWDDMSKLGSNTRLINFINSGNRPGPPVRPINASTPEEGFAQDGRVANIFCGVKQGGPHSNLTNRSFAPPLGSGYFRPNGPSSMWESKGREQPFEFVLCDPNEQFQVDRRVKFTSKQEVFDKERATEKKNFTNISIVPILITAVLGDRYSASVLQKTSLTIRANFSGVSLDCRWAMKWLVRLIQSQEGLGLSKAYIVIFNVCCLYLAQMIYSDSCPQVPGFDALS
mmetsp:Transcript_41879/g.67202  ORF Transcript_41879/g.67202 Transcript_41879/m.67202 type:complete len:403 (+) Transcript_41879:764-1972(+)